MKSFIVVGYYTRNSIYESASQVLARSLNRHNIPYYIEGVDDLGSWIKNVNYKPTFIKRMMLKFIDTNIVYVDCDAEFLTYPSLFDTLDCNIAVHLFNRSLYVAGQWPDEVLSGTIFLKSCKETFELVDKWEQECINNPGKWDQKSLQKVLNGNFYKLPAEYCKIFDTMKSVKEPVIVHYQLSRKMRRKNKLNNLRPSG